MNVLIAGCGGVGSTLAINMSRMGHTVSIVDPNPESFALLGKEFNGYTIIGNPIDQDVLRRAGIEGCDAVAAMTKSDNVNVMVSQVAKEIFHVKDVLTRIYDPAKEPIFATFGLRMVCPTSLTVDSTIEMLTGKDYVRYVNYGSQALTLSVHRNITLDEAYELVDRIPIAILHEDNSMTLINQREKDPKVLAEDKILTAHIADAGGIN